MRKTKLNIQDVLANLEALVDHAKQLDMPRIAITTEQAQAVIDFCRDVEKRSEDQEWIDVPDFLRRGSD